MRAVCFVDLATLRDPVALASTVAGLLGVWETASEPTTDAIARFLGERSVLLVLDNCEHMIMACAELAAGLVAACPRLTILATSREPLGVPGEVAWPVPSLPSPSVDGPLETTSTPAPSGPATTMPEGSDWLLASTCRRR